MKKKIAPVYQTITHIIRDRIISGEYKPNEVLPPELSLADEFAVSRHTIRAALNNLVLEGIIERRRGSGTTITASGAVRGSWAIRTAKDLMDEFAIPRSELKASRFKKLSRSSEAAKLLGTDSVFHVKRILYSNSGIYGVSNTYMDAETGRRIPIEALKDKASIAVVEQVTGTQVWHVRQIASAVKATRSMGKDLGIEPGEPLLLLIRVYLQQNGKPIVYAETCCRPDLYRQVVDFARQKTLT